VAKSSKSEFLNLTAFVDLFSTLVIFLLMTAVWNQIASLSTNVENATSSTAPQDPPPIKKVNLAISLFEDRLELMEDEESTRIPYLNGDIDVNQLEATLDLWKQKYPDRKDIIMNTSNPVAYRIMIKTFDTIVGKDWSDVGVNTQ
jgi:biopolymer transport protein ExbD